MHLRVPTGSETARLASIWYDGWQDAHAEILPKELAKHRTLESFQQRIEADLPSVLVAGPEGQPVGFSMINNDELYQLYVTASARGSGVAALLLAGAEAKLEEMGVKTTWLACAIGNERARKFYEKHGWHCTGTMINQLETPDGPFQLEVWRYEKHLHAVR